MDASALLLSDREIRELLQDRLATTFQGRTFSPQLQADIDDFIGDQVAGIYLATQQANDMLRRVFPCLVAGDR